MPRPAKPKPPQRKLSTGDFPAPLNRVGCETLALPELTQRQKPKYELTQPIGCRLYVGDCVKVMRARDEIKGDVRLVFADPPFNIGVDYTKKVDDKREQNEYEAWTLDWMSACNDLLCKHGSMFVYVGDGCVRGVLNAAYALDLRRVNWIIVSQRFGQYTDGRFINTKNHMFWFTKGPESKRVWNVREVMEPSDRLLKYNDARVKTSKYKGYRPYFDVWEHDNHGEVWSGKNMGRIQGTSVERMKGHPNQLPELLLARVIRCASNPGDIVVDPFTGSGTTPTVARWLGRRFVGCEMVPKFAASAWRRVVRGPVRDVRGNLTGVLDAKEA